MKVVVTGASGFLGRSVIRRLSGMANTVVVGVSRKALPGIVQVNDYASTPSGDVLIHLAETAHRGVAERLGQSYEREAFEALNALLKKHYRRVVYTSSAVLYGDRERTPRRPSEEVFAVDVYTRVKHRGERAVLESSGSVVARLGNLFGPGMAEDSVISVILGQIPGTGPVRVRDTKPVRDFVWVDDAAEAIAGMAIGGADGIFNVGSGIGHSVGDVAELSLGIAGERARPIVATQPEPRISHLVLDISDTVSTWAWSPAMRFEQGIGCLMTPVRHTNS